MTEAGSLESSLFGDNLDGVHAGIVPDWLERENKFAQCIGLQSVKFLPQRAIRSTSCLEDVESPQKRNTVEVDIEFTTAHAAASGIGGAVKDLVEMEDGHVGSLRNRKGVGEIPEPLTAVETGIICSRNRLQQWMSTTAAVIAVRLPERSIRRRIRHIPCGHTDGVHPVR